MKKLLQKYQMCFYIFTLLFCFSVNTAYSDYSFSANGKSYKIVETKLNWTSAAAAAVAAGGYLTHINSQTEQTAIWDAIVNGAKISKDYTSVSDGGQIAFIWIGANDLSNEGTWIWDGDNSGSGDNFWNGQGSQGNGDGAPVNNSYYNWGGKSQYGYPKEPDNYVNSQDAAAIGLEPWPKNNGVLGSGGEWNDINAANTIYYIIEFDYAGKPAKPTKPTGTSSLCQGTYYTDFTTTETIDAKTYIWSVTPMNAGSFSGEGKVGTLSWNPSFNGTAEISVLATNPIGDGPSSDKFSVTVKPRPALNEKPSGTNQLCMNSANSTYTITGVAEATSYNWSISPASAGQIIGTGKSISIDWTDTYYGEVVIKVLGVNDCGAGSNSDSLKVNISKIPDKPSKPEGKTQFYQNDLDGSFMTNPVPLAASYTWNLNPPESGKLKSDKNNVTVDWDENFAGDVHLSVASENSCGKSTNSDELTINVSSKPEKPIIPSGNVDLCQGNDTSSYQTKDCIGAKKYLWSINPASAGTTKDTSKKCIVTWNKNYFGEVKISVTAVGNLDKSDPSDQQTININPLPLKCEKPSGESHLCVGQKNIEYQVNSNEFAKSYVWSLTPSEAGTINGTTEKAIINLSDTFLGSFSISVKALNDCGTGQLSDNFTVSVTGKPNKPNRPTGITSTIKGTKNIEYTTEIVEDADKYSWNLTPSNAGSLKENINSCSVDWNINFIGNATLSVKTNNSCGESEFSNGLSIEVKDSVVSVSEQIENKFGTLILKAYPNPAGNNFTLEVISQNLFLNSSLNIYDLQGKFVSNIFKGNVNIGTNNFELNTNGLAPGQYFVGIQTSTESVILQFIIVK